MSDDARKPPKFPWDYDVPNDAFWQSIEYTAARNFLQCYTESEISKMHFDNTVPLPSKYKSLRQYLDKTFKEEEEEAAPTPLLDANYQKWADLKLAMSTMEYHMKNYDKQEVIVREMYDNAKDTNKKMSALNNLTGIMEEKEKFAEMEKMAKEVLPWMQAHELLGKDSPQALNCMRMIATSVWKQKRYVEGEEWLEKTGGLVGDMKEGKFGKYWDTEVKLLAEKKRALWEWRKGQGEE